MHRRTQGASGPIGGFADYLWKVLEAWVVTGPWISVAWPQKSAQRQTHEHELLPRGVQHVV